AHPLPFPSYQCRPSPTKHIPHISNTRTCPQGHILVFPLPLPRLEHQNVPVWARSGVRARPLLYPSNTRMCPHRHVLVLGRLSSPFPPSQTPESAHMGMFWCLGTSPLCFPRLEHKNEPLPSPLPRLEHQDVPFWARSGV